MRRPFVSLLGVFFLAAGAQGVAAPVPAAPAELSAEKVVTVKLKFDVANPTVPVGIESVSPDPVELSRGKKHFAHWVLSPAGAGTLKIKMQDKGGKPFRKHPTGRGERDHVYSDAAELGVDGTKYKYTVSVRADGQMKDFVLDPIIIIQP